MIKKKYIFKNILIIIFIYFFFHSIFNINFVNTQENLEGIQNQIKTQDKKIKKLEKAILESQKKVSQYSGESISLKKEIANLNYLNAKLKKTIYNKELEIKKLNKNISNISNNIENNYDKINKLKEKIKENIFKMNQISNFSLFKTVLLGKPLTNISNDLLEIENIQKIFQKNLKTFSSISEILFQERNEKLEENKKLDSEKEQLSDKKNLLVKNKEDKNYLLKITKNKEENFKKILSQQQKEKEKFEEQLFKLESRLEFVLNKNSIPPKKIGLFVWPTPTYPTNYHWITQFFGLTTFREIFYNGKGHNGIDIGVPIGTPVYSVMSGVIFDIGDTTKICRKIQYGKWITIDHQNGLTTMYAHLSLIKVKKGQKIKRGEKIGLSGNTGYSTGPHLHFTTYYSDGLKIKTIPHLFKGSRCYGKMVKIPIASHQAYTDPFDYLPKPEFPRIKAVSYKNKSIYIKELQNMLKYEKVFPRNISANGFYGSVTEQSVKRWKEKYSIKGSGKIFSKKDASFFKNIY